MMNSCEQASLPTRKRLNFPYPLRHPYPHRYCLLIAYLVVVWNGFAPSASIAQEQISETAYEIRDIVRRTIADNPKNFHPPVFRETPETLEYFWGGVISGGDAEDATVDYPLRRPTETLTMLELMRRSVAKEDRSQSYWVPILDRAEQLVARAITLLEPFDMPPDEIAMETRRLDEEARMILDAAARRVAESKGKLPLEVPNPHIAWRVEEKTVEVPLKSYRTEARIRSIRLPDNRLVEQTYEVRVPLTETRVQTYSATVPATDNRVRLETNPDGAEIFYINSLNFLVGNVVAKKQGRAFDAYENWKAPPWKQATGVANLKGPYFFRLRWLDDRDEYRSGVITVDSDDPIRFVKSPR